MQYIFCASLFETTTKESTKQDKLCSSTSYDYLCKQSVNEIIKSINFTAVSAFFHMLPNILKNPTKKKKKKASIAHWQQDPLIFLSLKEKKKVVKQSSAKLQSRVI